jgi:hypothetical protein
VVVLDEVETIQRMNSQTREKSLNALRQLMDMLAADELPGLYLVVTGTPDFFDGYKGVKSLAPLHQRVAVKFDAETRFDNYRAPQVRLQTFTAERLFEVGGRVRGIYPATDTSRAAAKVDDVFLRALVEQVTSGFGGKVSVAPRVFLRELVDVLDRVDQYQEFDPRQHYKLDLREEDLRPEELAAAHGVPIPDNTGDEETDAADARPPRRLDG